MLVERDGTAYAPGSHNRYVASCLYWMNRFGVAFDDALRWALSAFADYEFAEHSVESTARSCYTLAEEHATHRLGDYERPAGRPKDRAARAKATVEEMKGFADAYMRARLNVFNHSVEVSIGQRPWERLSDRIENSLWVKMQEEGINADVWQIHSLLTSDYVREHHPLCDYLGALDPWDGSTDHIARMASTVHVKGPQDTFNEAFKRWMVGLVAGALDDDVVNQTILVLIGRQGCFKTSFAQNILPPELRSYYTTKSNSMRMTKDDMFTMTEFMVVNFEEIDTMPPAELNQLKAMVTQRHVDERMAYGRNKVHLSHIASFIGTGDNLQFLSDDTGNRRWMPFEVDWIENPWKTRLPYEGVFAQAFALYRQAFKYWYDDDETQRMSSHVRRFETPRSELELINAHFRKPRENEVPTYMNTSQILTSFGNCGVRLNVTKIGKALREMGFTSLHLRHGNVWSVVQRSADEMRRYVPDSKDDAGDNALPF